MENGIVLYTTHCPKCRVLESKMQNKGIPYQVCDNVEEMKNLGISSLPVLAVNGEMMDFPVANKYINSL